jgi:hypothetical protein
MQRCRMCESLLVILSTGGTCPYDQAIFGAAASPYSFETRFQPISKKEVPVSMKFWICCFALVLVAAASAKEREYESGTLLSMDSSTCGMQEKGGKTLTGELIGSDAQNKKTQQVLCQEYVLQTDRVIYHIRPKDDKHPALLPIGKTAQFRIQKDKLILRVPESDAKERQYIVVSMTPRTDRNPDPQSASKN